MNHNFMLEMILTPIFFSLREKWLISSQDNKHHNKSNKKKTMTNLYFFLVINLFNIITDYKIRNIIHR